MYTNFKKGFGMEEDLHITGREKLLQPIEGLRSDLNALTCPGANTALVLEISQKLDLLILTYYKSFDFPLYLAPEHRIKINTDVAARLNAR